MNFLYIAGRIFVNDCGRGLLSSPIPFFARSRGGLSGHRLPLTPYSIPVLASPDALRGMPITIFDGIGPFSGACFLWRVTPLSRQSLDIAIMSVSMFDLATSYNGEGLFLFGWSLRIW
jgi:hypothetical protein